MFLNANVFFDRAKAALERAQKNGTDRSGNNLDAVDAILFSVIALEAFMNEAIKLAEEDFNKGDPQLSTILMFNQMASEVERFQGNLQLKFMLALCTFKGELYNRGQSPFQEFCLLLELRNHLVHHKPKEFFSRKENGAIEFIPTKLLDKIRSQDILADNIADKASWISKISTVAAAVWACNCAVDMVQSILSAIPIGIYKHQMDLFYAKSFQHVKSR